MKNINVNETSDDDKYLKKMFTMQPREFNKKLP